MENAHASKGLDVEFDCVLFSDIDTSVKYFLLIRPSCAHDYARELTLEQPPS